MDTHRSKGTDAPLCKVCKTRHWGTCLNHAAKGALSTRPGVRSAEAKVKAARPKTKSKGRK